MSHLARWVHPSFRRPLEWVCERCPTPRQARKVKEAKVKKAAVEGSEAVLWPPLSEEHRRKISAANTGQQKGPMSAEHRE